MPKVLRVKIKRNKTPEKTSYVYPPEYDARKAQVLTYETQHPLGEKDVVDRGNRDEYCLIVVKDADAAGFLKSPDIKEVTVDAAVDEVGKWSGVDERAPLERKVGALNSDGTPEPVGRKKNFLTDITETISDFKKREGTV